MFLSGDHTTTSPHLVLRIFPCSVFCLLGNNVSGSAHQAWVVACSTHLRLGNPHTSGRSSPVWKTSCTFLGLPVSPVLFCSVLFGPVLSSSVLFCHWFWFWFCCLPVRSIWFCLLSGSASCSSPNSVLLCDKLRVNPSSALNFLSMFSFARRFPTTLRATRSGGLF